MKEERRFFGGRPQTPGKGLRPLHPHSSAFLSSDVYGHNWCCSTATITSQQASEHLSRAVRLFIAVILLVVKTVELALGH